MQKIWAEQSEPLNTIKRKQSVKKIREPLAEGKLEIVDNIGLMRSCEPSGGIFRQPRKFRPPGEQFGKPKCNEVSA